MTPPLSSLLWFLVVIAAIPALLWLVKRSQRGAGLGNGITRSVSVLPLSASQRIVTVEVGRGEQRCWLVLGVTPNQISTLYTMLPQDEAASAPPSPNTAFAQLLTRLRGDGHAS
ncbi:MAG: flagellar biosynthetic protein FliO [Burkholderiales bacterium]|nr:flagellar biosynthetic protein FliO [Burkholderiales bacterium]